MSLFTGTCEVKTLRQDLGDVINRHSAESKSATPDSILAGYLLDCLEAWDRAVQAREKWYGRWEEKNVQTTNPTDEIASKI